MNDILITKLGLSSLFNDLEFLIKQTECSLIKDELISEQLNVLNELMNMNFEE